MMEDGFYWLTEIDCEPEVVQIIGNTMLLFGDRSCYESEGIWFDSWGDKIDIVSLIGPIQPPDA